MVKNKKGQEYGFMIAGIIAVVLIGIVLMSFYTISAGERGVLMTFGKPSMDSVTEGLHFKFPIAQTVKKMEVRTRKIETDADSASKDLQNVETTIALNYHLMPASVPRLYQEIGSDYQERIIDPAIQESVKAVTARFTAEELITRRSEVRYEMQDELTIRLKKSYIDVDDFNIVNFQFSEEFDKAIEAKVTAQQLKLKAEMDLERILVEKEQIIARGQAEAEALRLQKSEITPDLVKLREIEVKSKALDVQLEAINKWDGILPQVTGGAMPFIDVREQNTIKKQI